MGSIETSNYRKRRKENLIKVCGSKCNICGYHKTNSALEFHHIKPEEKSFGISAGGICRDLETDLQEVNKCILVCANCHREIHDNFYSEEFLLSKKIYDVEFANSLRKEKNKKQYFCRDCGKEITRYSTSGLCESCYKKTLRVVNRPEREELKKMIRTKPFTEIGKTFGVSDKAIVKWCKAEGLPFRKKDINAISDVQWELV